MGKLFGTDGARGIANTELTCELAMKIGMAAASVLTKNKNERAKILIGKDTRLSSDMLEGALIAGICSVGVDVVCLGVVPTPAVAYLVKKYKADAGIMISASHNSFEFNGIKIFSSQGHKLPDAVEEEIEKIVLGEVELNLNNIKYSDIGTKTYLKSAVDDYIEHIITTIDGNLSGLKVAFDCSNGSASRTASKLFSSLGVECVMLNNTPDGININDNCGSVHIDNLAEYVKMHDLDAGIAFDGDADRCLAIDNKGNIIDGDFIMAICAKALKQQGKLKRDTVVGTVMTNMGFNRFCSYNELNFVATKVGDRYVLEEMLKENYNFGGEQSGHIIFLDYSTTGDGQLTAVQLLSILKNANKPFSEVAGIIKKFPQVMINVKISNEGKMKFYNDPEIKSAIENVKNEFTSTDGSTNTGRILVRTSGTEPLVRVMLEGEDLDKITELANKVAGLIKERLT